MNSPEFYEDINQDCIWDVIDIIMVINHIIGTSLLDENQQNYADLNEDGLINIIDVLQLVNIIIS